MPPADLHLKVVKTEPPIELERWGVGSSNTQTNVIAASGLQS